MTQCIPIVSIVPAAGPSYGGYGCGGGYGGRQLRLGGLFSKHMGGCGGGHKLCGGGCGGGHGGGLFSVGWAACGWLRWLHDHHVVHLRSKSMFRGPS